MEKNKILWSVSAVVVIVVVLIVIFSDGKKDMVVVPVNENNPEVVDEVEGVEDTTEGSISASGGTSTTLGERLTYQQAIATYEDKRIQFNADCKATPSNMTYKDGTYLMLDNRSAGSLTIKIGTSSYPIGGYAFKIVKLANVNRSISILVDCNERQNVATILVQE